MREKWFILDERRRFCLLFFIVGGWGVSFIGWWFGIEKFRK